jgi:carbon-monoxide dehydrogenase medium subunit
VELFRGPKETTLGRGEILTAVLLDPPSPSARAVFLRKGRTKMDIATASVAVLLEMDRGVCKKARVAAGSVAPVPLRLTKVETLLEGNRLDDAVIEAARATASSEVAPITDIRSTEEYRRHLVGVFVERAIRDVLLPVTSGGGRR